MPSRPRRSATLTLVALLLAAARASAADPFADAVADIAIGAGGGFGSDLLPEIVLGPPHGGGAVQQSLDVVSLGNMGHITLRFDQPVICDGDGPDFTVFENAFHVNSPEGPVFEEFGIVAVSQDGVTFVDLPYDPVSHAGLAGRSPVLTNPDNGIDPLDPTVSGGDAFDLATVGLPWVAFVRVTDPGADIPDAGDRIPPGDKGGFDLDAVAALHACDPAAQPNSTPTEAATPSFTPTPIVAGSTPTAPARPPGDLDGDGRVDDVDRRRLVAEIFDGDGDAGSTAAGGDVTSGPEADVDRDGAVTAADLVAIGAQAR